MLDEDRVRQLPRPLLLAVPEQRLVVAALHLPFLDRVLRDALAADVHPRHVVRRVHREEQQEREQVDADQDQHAVADTADDVVDHGAAPSAASVRAAVSRSRRRQKYHAGTMAMPTSGKREQRNRPPDRLVPFGDLLRAELGIEPQVADVVAHDLRRLAVADPLVIGGGRRREVAEAPHGVVLHDLDHPVDELLLFRTVLEELHLLEQLVELGILVVRVVLAVAVGQRLRVRSVEHEQEVLRIGIVGEPAPEEDLDRALGHLVLEAVVVGRAHLHLHADLRELLRVPVEQRLDARRRRGLVVEVEHQRLAGLRIAPVGIARLGEQLLRFLDRAAHRLAVGAFAVDHRIERGGSVFAIAEQRRRQRTLRRDTLPALEDRDVLFPVDGDRQRLPQLAVALGLRRRIALAHDRVEPVEADVPVVRFDRRRQA